MSVRRDFQVWIRLTAWQGDEGVGPFAYSEKNMPRDDWSPVVKTIRDRLANGNNNNNTGGSIGSSSFATTKTNNTDYKILFGDGCGYYYDCCLLNLYPDERSGMRYHSDPDQGRLWDYATTVVSVGATRRFSFRSTAGVSNAGAAVGNDEKEPIVQKTKKKAMSQMKPQPHSFVVMHGDATHMFGDCQERFQHAVKKGGASSRSNSNKHTKASRIASKNSKGQNSACVSPCARASLVFKRTWNYGQQRKEIK